MQLAPDYRPEFESLAKLLLEVARERSTNQLFNTVVQRMAERPHVALAALWLLDKGDICSTRTRQAQCSDRSRCLHLVASAKLPLETTGAERWSRIKEQIGRIPFGFGEIGRVISTGQPFVTSNAEQDRSGIGENDWAKQAGIRRLDAQPIIFDAERLGVVALFSRIPTPAQGPTWVRIFADHIATAIVNARAFEENERLKHQLELENTYLQEEVKEAKAFGDIIGQSQALKFLLRQVEKVARTDATVLILGETGLANAALDNDKNPSQFPWFNAWCGNVDMCGFKKAPLYYREVIWGDAKINLAVHAPIPAGRNEKVSRWGWPDERQSWTWPGSEGTRLM